MTKPLQASIESYAEALNKLDTTRAEPDFLGCLLARDSLQSELSRQEHPGLDVILRVIELDKHLVAHAGAIASLAELSAWRSIVKPSEDAWWWYPERQPSARNAAIADYTATLNQATDPPTVQQVLECLLARDRLQANLDQTSTHDADLVLQVTQLDKRLFNYSDILADQEDLSAWRSIVKPAENTWWWRPEHPPEPSDVAGDTFLTVIAGLFFTLALTTSMEIIRRFLAAGGDFTAYLLASIQVVSAAVVGGSFTQSGRDLLNRAWKWIGIKRRLRHEATAVLSTILLISAVALRLSLPTFARWYNARAVAQTRDGQVTSAMDNLKRAISLVPDFAQAHYNLGSIHEDLLEHDKAITEYRTAIRADAQLDVAYNNLGRLLVVQTRDYPLAIITLRQGLVNAQSDETRYAIQKNLGWAYVASEQYDLAIESLKRAISVYGDRGAPHCLLAQAYEKLKDSKSALSEWEPCLAYANLSDPYESGWAAVARQRLEAQGGKP